MVAFEPGIPEEQAVIPALPVTFRPRELTPAETETLNFHLSHARSENTRKSYERQWRAFVKWCGETKHLPFPVAAETLCLYLAHLSEQGHKISKLEQSLSAIRAVHHDTDHTTLGVFSHAHIKATLSSIKRTMATDGRSAKKKPRHFSQEEITAMVNSCPDTPQGVMDKALITLGFNSGMRASEYCALRLADVAFESTGVVISIRTSKTDQHGAGESVFIRELAPHQQHLSAVKALKAWLELREHYPQAGGEVFIAFRKGGQTPHLTNGLIHGLTRESVTTLLQRCAERAGIEPGQQSISSHGMRHSFITQGFSRHISTATLSKTSRHKSLKALMAYDQTTLKESAVSGLWA